MRINPVILLYLFAPLTQGIIQKSADSKYLALYDFDTTIVDPPDEWLKWLNFKKGDVLDILEKTYPDAWLARHLDTEEEGWLLPFMVTPTTRDTDPSTDGGGEKSDQIYRAMEDFDAGSLEGFLSYSKGDMFTNITKYKRFWEAQFQDTEVKGIIDSRKVNNLGVGVGLFDLYSESRNDHLISVRKGEHFYIANNRDDPVTWEATSKDDDNETGLIPNIAVVIVPQKTENKMKLSEVAVKEEVMTLTHFDGASITNFLSFQSGEILTVLQKPTKDTWVAKSYTNDNTGYIPSFMVAKAQEVKDKDKDDDRKIFRAIQNSTAASLGLESAGFLSFSKGAKLHIIRGGPEDRVWYGRALGTMEEGFLAKVDVVDQCDYRGDVTRTDGTGVHTRYGDLCVPRPTPCQCGNKRMTGESLSEYCCVPTNSSCSKAMIKGTNDTIINCTEGRVLPLSKPCHDTCYNDYKTTQYFDYIFGQYTCQSELNEKCIPILGIPTLGMCRGAQISGCEDVRECNSKLRCVDYPGSKLTHISTDIISSHHYCSYSRHCGTGQYDYIDRSDEKVTNPLASQKIDYRFLKTCIDKHGQPGITCNRDGGVECWAMPFWCYKDFEGSCYVQQDIKLGTANEMLCQNHTFWRGVDQYIHKHNNKTKQFGVKCTGKIQQSYYPWYYAAMGFVVSYYRTSCEDQSHRVHATNTSCPNPDTYLQIFVDKFCTSENPSNESQNICKDPRKWLKFKDPFTNELLHNLDSDLLKEWLKNYEDPHRCWDSCSAPGPNCEACTNKHYFVCEDLCIHEDLLCDGHPQCLNNEDEDFNMCIKKWTEKKVFSQQANIKCRSRMYPSMDILASPCDGVVECHDRSDESQCSDDTISTLVLIFVVLEILVLYSILKYNREKIGRMKGMRKKKKSCNEPIFYKDLIFGNFQNNPNESAVIKKINHFLFYIIFSERREKMNEILLEFYDMLYVILNNDEAEVFAYLHRNLDPALAMAITEAKFPGLKQRTINFIERKCSSKFITNFQDKLKTEWTTLNRVLSTSYPLFFKMISHHLDLVKDIILTISLLVTMGGPVAVYNFPTRFSSAVVMLSAGAIFFPMIMSSIHLVISDPYLIFLFMRRTAERLKRRMMIFICLSCSFLNEFFLEFNYEELHEKSIEKAKEFIENGEDEVLKLFEDCKIVKKQVLEHYKINLGMKTLYAASLQILLLLLTRTKTPTTRGLESFFEKDTFLGVNVNPDLILAISVSLSLKTCIFMHIKAVSMEKGIFRMKAKIAVFAWAVFAIVRRIISVLAFFSPSLGLFSLLHHWQAENTPFKVRLDMISENPANFQTSNIHLYNMSEEVAWSLLDRWNYKDQNDPVPPDYSIYTGTTLKYTLFAFTALFCLKMMLFLVIKICTSEDFRERKNYFHKFTHLFQVTNIPFPYQDWDVGNYNSIQTFIDRYRKTEIEMLASFGITFLFTLIYMIPLTYTGVIFYILQHSAIVHHHIVLLVYNIWMRHNFLQKFIGTKEEEDISKVNSVNVAIGFPVCLIVSSVLEVGFYFLYNRKV